MDLNIRNVNWWGAAMNISLVVFVVIELVLFSTLLNSVTNKLVVFPLERIFNTIQTNASKLMVRWTRQHISGARQTYTQTHNNLYEQTVCLIGWRVRVTRVTIGCMALADCATHQQGGAG